MSFIAILHRVLFKKVVLQRATKQKNAYICDVMWPKNPQDGHIESVTVFTTTGQRIALISCIYAIGVPAPIYCYIQVWGIASFIVVKVLSEPSD